MNRDLTRAIYALVATNICCTACLGCYFNSALKHIGYGERESAICVEEISSTHATEKATLVTVSYDEKLDLDTSFKTYMDYRTITDTSSAQYNLQQHAWTDENGLRRIGDTYMVALGTYYTENCGEQFHVILDSGSEFDVTVGDIKDDRHTDVNNQYSPVYDNDGNFISANIIEFIVDTDLMPSCVRRSGTVGTLNDFEGNVISIERLYDGLTV